MNIFYAIYHYAIPHSGNNHRARALHHDALLAYVLLFLLLNLGFRIIHRQLPDILGYATDIRINELLVSTNEKRVDAGLSELRLNEILSRAASEKASDMFANNYWAHNSPNGKTPWDFIVRSGYTYTLAGENLAKNFQTSKGVIDAWMASPSHKDNILKQGYQDVGFAVVNGVLNGEETTLVVQMFGATAARTVAKIPQVQAQEPEVLPEPVTEVPIVTAPVTIIAPKIDVQKATHTSVYLFIAVLLAIFTLDAMVVSRKRIVRLVGHNFAHVVFLSSIVGFGLFMIRGTLL